MSIWASDSSNEGRLVRKRRQKWDKQLLTNLNWALNFIGIVILVGLTAWDTNQLKKIGRQTDGGGGLVVIGALKLYLDYINLFLLLLRASNR